MSNIIYTQQIVQKKSQWASFFLTLFFGPLGAFYASALTGVLTLLISLGLAVFTMGLSLLLTWPMTIAWAAIVVSNNNAKAEFQARQLQQQGE